MSTQVFNRMGVLVNSVPAIPPPVQPIRIPEENYAKTVGLHSTASHLRSRKVRRDIYTPANYIYNCGSPKDLAGTLYKKSNVRSPPVRVIQKMGRITFSIYRTSSVEQTPLRKMPQKH
jgi:hypothetical protein